MGVKVRARLVLCWSEHLALWTFPYIILGIVEHLGPVVPLVDDHVGERATSCVVPAISVVDFLYHPLSLLRTEASQITGQGGGWSRIFFIVSPRSMYRVAKCWIASILSSGSVPSFK